VRLPFQEVDLCALCSYKATQENLVNSDNVLVAQTYP